MFTSRIQIKQVSGIWKNSQKSKTYARVDADPHHGEANHGTQHFGPMEMVQHHRQSISWNYGLDNITKHTYKLEIISINFY